MCEYWKNNKMIEFKSMNSVKKLKIRLWSVSLLESILTAMQGYGACCPLSLEREKKCSETEPSFMYDL